MKPLSRPTSHRDCTDKSGPAKPAERTIRSQGQAMRRLLRSDTIRFLDTRPKGVPECSTPASLNVRAGASGRMMSVKYRKAPGLVTRCLTAQPTTNESLSSRNFYRRVAAHAVCKYFFIRCRFTGSASA